MRQLALVASAWRAVRASTARAIRLYSKLGFVEEGRSPGATRLEAGAYDDDVLMGRRVGRRQQIL